MGRVSSSVLGLLPWGTLQSRFPLPYTKSASLGGPIKSPCDLPVRSAALCPELSRADSQNPTGCRGSLQAGLLPMESLVLPLCTRSPSTAPWCC